MDSELSETAHARGRDASESCSSSLATLQLSSSVLHDHCCRLLFRCRESRSDRNEVEIRGLGRCDLAEAKWTVSALDSNEIEPWIIRVCPVAQAPNKRTHGCGSRTTILDDLDGSMLESTTRLALEIASTSTRAHLKRRCNTSSISIQVPPWASMLNKSSDSADLLHPAPGLDAWQHEPLAPS